MMAASFMFNKDSWPENCNHNNNTSSAPDVPDLQHDLMMFTITGTRKNCNHNNNTSSAPDVPDLQQDLMMFTITGTPRNCNHNNNTSSAPDVPDLQHDLLMFTGTQEEVNKYSGVYLNNNYIALYAVKNYELKFTAPETSENVVISITE